MTFCVSTAVSTLEADIPSDRQRATVYSPTIERDRYTHMKIFIIFLFLNKNFFKRLYFADVSCILLVKNNE